MVAECVPYFMQISKNAQLLKILRPYNITLEITLLSVNVYLEMYHVISIAAVASYFVPLVIVLLRKAWRDQFFLLFALYWSVGGIVNLFDVIPGVSKEAIHNIGIFYNMLDVPFILAILYFTTSYHFVQRAAFGGIVLLLLVQVISIINGGIGYDSQKYALGMGGDCDDHTILMVSALKAIGVHARMVLTEGHLYPELLCGDEKNFEKVNTAIMSLFSREVKGNIYYHEENGQFWLNLDYSARHPGGPYVSDKAFAIITP